MNGRKTSATFEVLAGSNITSAICEAIKLAGEHGYDSENGALIAFDFNGVSVSVKANSDPVLIYRDWLRALSGYIDKKVGPYPSPILTDREKANDARIEAENEAMRQERQAQHDAKANAKRVAVEAKLTNAPSIELANEDGWQQFKDNNQDGYGGAVVTYAECWARLMQLELANGNNLEDVAEATSQEADLEGITGFMYGAAVSILATCWKYGEQLRHWHNLDTQIGDEGEKANESGGVLNPALLTISV